MLNEGTAKPESLIKEVKKDKLGRSAFVKGTAVAAIALSLFTIYKTVINLPECHAFIIMKPRRSEVLTKEETNLEVLVDVPFFSRYNQFFRPKFSPNGENIVFYASRSNFRKSDSCDLLVVKSDGTRLRRLVLDDHFSPHDPFWIDNNNVGFNYSYRREGAYRGYHQIFYKIPIMPGGKISKLETKYPKEAAYLARLSYYNGIEIAQAGRREGDKLVIGKDWEGNKREYLKDIWVFESYIEGKLNESANNWEYFYISPSGTRAAYKKVIGDSTNLYIQEIEEFSKVKSIIPIGEPVLIEGSSLFGFITQGENKGNVVVQHTNDDIVMLNQDGKKMSTLCKNPPVYLRSYDVDLAQDGSSLLCTPFIEGEIYSLRLNQK